MASSAESNVYARASSTLAGNAGLTLSPWHYEQIANKSTRTKGHGYFAVAILRTDGTNPLEKQRPAASLMLKSQVGVRIVANLRPGAMAADYEAGLAFITAARAELITSGVGSQDSDGPIKFHFISSTSRVIADGTHLLVELVFWAWHQLETLTPA